MFPGGREGVNWGKMDLSGIVPTDKVGKSLVIIKRKHPHTFFLVVSFLVMCK